MQQENWEKVKEILQKALTLPLNERSSFLENADLTEAVRAEVESLLAFEEEAGNLMDLPAIEFSKHFFADETDYTNSAIGQNVGHYRIVRELGYGGMGAVYLAERTDGKFEQKIALKLLKREMNTREIRRRFEQERNILASLEHPNIARLLDAGTTDDQIPFIAMEYIEGLPISEYCESQSLSLEARLDLFQTVCQAVNFAHRNLIVHRDLKPSNIFVTKDGVPKLLDFGISKILSGEFDNANTATVTKLGAMTPAYASPEQLQNKSVTTATDIYSLGVILYELLSGHRPFEEKENDFKKIYKAVLEIEPPLPSLLVETLSKTISDEIGTQTKLKDKSLFNIEKSVDYSKQKTESNESRQTVAKPIPVNSQNLRGDLDNIVLKSLRKEPERRYLSAENFAEDIKRYLKGLPVTARPNTFSYRAEKFFKRNRATAIAAIFVIIAIAAGIIATLWQSRIARAERDRAELETAKSKKINEYMQNVLNFSNAHWNSSNPQRKRDAKISEALDEALKNIDTDLADQPEIQAEVLSNIAATFCSQGNYAKCEQLAQQSLEKFQQTLGSKNPKSMRALSQLGEAKYMLGKAAEAEKLFIETVDYFQPKTDKDTVEIIALATAYNNLATVYLNGTDKSAEVEKLYKAGIELTKDLKGKNRSMYPVLLGNLGFFYSGRGNFQEAADFYNQSLEELRLANNDNSYDAGSLYMKMGVNFTDMGEYEQADICLQKSYETLSKTVGENHLYTGLALYRMANNYYKQERIDEAAKIVDKNLEQQYQAFPNGHILVGWLERLKGEIYTKKGDLKQGEEYLRKSLNYFLKTAKEPHRNISQAKLSLGENLMAQKRYVEAREFVASAVENFSKYPGEDHPFTKQSREILNKIPE